MNQNRSMLHTLPAGVGNILRAFLRRRLFAGLLCLLIGLACLPANAQAKEPVVVVIDPGHGGEGNRGGEVPGQFLEKELTLQAARAMKQTLEQFEGVTVYLTRTADQELSLEERAAIAAAYGADFLFSLHFNMSSAHNLYGSEIWTSAFGEYYSAGQTFGRIWLGEMAGYGQFLRGAKTRLNSRGSDYYGVIRASRELGIPCVILEHCYMDHAIDSRQIDTAQKVSAMGISDALAVAKYFRLTSPALGLDYSNYAYEPVKAPAGAAAPDTTPPVRADMTVLGIDRNTGKVDITLSASDPESGILYYSYSLDGGATWSVLTPFGTSGTAAFSITVPSGSSPVLLYRAYNGYDRFTDSNAAALGAFAAR